MARLANMTRLLGCALERNKYPFSEFSSLADRQAIHMSTALEQAQQQWEPAIRSESDESNGSAPEEPATPLEMIELDLALQYQDYLEKGFEGAVLDALELVGGKLLFRMRMNGASGFDWVAAISLNSMDEPRIALVVQPAGNGPLEVKDASASEMPIASVARAYSNLLLHLETPAD